MSLFQKIKASINAMRLIWRNKRAIWKIYRRDEDVRQLHQDKIECDECIVACGPEGKTCEEHKEQIDEVFNL